MAVEASGDRSALAQITEYLSEEGSHPTLSILEEKTLEIFQDRIDYLDSDINSLLLKCDQKEFKKLLEDKGIDPSKFTSYIKGVCVVKTSSEEKVTNVAKSNFLMHILQEDLEDGIEITKGNDYWPIDHLSKQNQARLLEFFNTGKIPTFDSTVAGAGAASATTRTSDDEWLELVREADKLDIPQLFNALVKAKIPDQPKSLDERKKFYELMLNIGDSSSRFNSLGNLRKDYEIELIKADLDGKTIEDNLLMGIQHFAPLGSPDPDALIKLLKKCPNATTISISGLNQEQINLLATTAPQCSHLNVTNGTFETLPEFPHLTSLDCDRCTALTTLSLPIATKVNCEECTALTHISLPQATKVACVGCSRLSTLLCPLAKRINCSECNALTHISLPQATKVVCEMCTALTHISLPQATNVACNGCTALTNLSLPLATKVGCFRCTALTTLSLPLATEVWCIGCTTLTTLSLPLATDVRCGRCTGLTTLSLPKATKANCGMCTALTTLSLPLATEVYCGGCTALIRLSLPKATKANCDMCTALTTLSLPLATEVSCSGCTALTNPSLPKATKVNCHRCTALTTLSLPKATEVLCFGCTALTHASLPQATYVDCGGCSRLSTLLCPLAERVNCAECNALTYFLTPLLATLVYAWDLYSTITAARLRARLYDPPEEVV